MPTKVVSLARAVRTHVSLGMHVHFASTPSRSNAAILELARAFRGTDPRFLLSSTGFHSLAHLLGMLRLGRRYLACFFGDHHPAPRPNALWTRVEREGAILERWPVLAYVGALRAGALGERFTTTRSLAGTDLGADLARLGRYHEVPDPVEPGARVGLVTALRPDVTFLHAARADAEGRVVTSAPFSEAYWSALGAKRGVIVTVEEIVDREVTLRSPEALRIPPSRVLAVCEAPFGAHPQALFTTQGLGAPAYGDDFEHYALWRRLAEGDAIEPLRALLEADEPRAAYRAFVGAQRLDALAAAERPTRRTSPEPEPLEIHPVEFAEARAAAEPDADTRLVLLGARRIAEAVLARGRRTILAGVGVSFLAVRLAKLLLEPHGVEVEVAVETGIVDVDCGVDAHPYLLAFENVARAGRLSGIEETLGGLACGARNGCLAVFGAAQIDVSGDVNSTRLADGRVLVGPGGAPDLAACAEESIVLVRCDRARLVGRVDHVTSRGRELREVVTDRAVLARHAEGWRASQLVAARDDEALDDIAAAVRRACPWPLEIERALASPFSTTELAHARALARARA